MTPILSKPMYALALAAFVAPAGCGTDVINETSTSTGTATGTSTGTATGTATGTSTGTTTNTGTCNSGNFSFFVIGLAAIQAAGGPEGLGGNLGGLAGADALCQSAANAVGACDKTWLAFLSVTDGGDGTPINAIDRIGEGPWYNVDGLLLAQDKAGLLQTRPAGATDVVYSDGWKEWPFNQCLTDELGACTLSYGDSHDTLTGSDRNGQLFNTDQRYTCNDWTSTSVDVELPIGHSWPRQLGDSNPDIASWLYAHTIHGCGANINLTDSMEQGVGGDGGYGAFYCFAL
jgi:hypothetical protein